MSVTIFAIVLVLGILSLLQRVLPWFLYKRYSVGALPRKLFDLVAISAFSSLMIYNISSFTYQDILPLGAALIVAYRTRNIGISILIAMLVSFILTII